MANRKKTIISPKDQQKILSLYKVNFLSLKELAEAFNHSPSGIKSIIQNLDSTVYNSRKLLGRNEYHIKDGKNEIWKKLKATTKNRYEVSNYGRIKSFAYNAEGTILKCKMHGGYLMLDYHDLETESRKHALVHRLVALHFLGKPPKDKPNVIHLDGNKANNRAENLRYANAVETGKYHVLNEKNRVLIENRNAQRTTGQKLTLTQVETIRKILSNPKKQVKKSVLAARYNVSEMTIYRIQNGENWGNKGTPIAYTKKGNNLLSKASVIEIKKLLLQNKLKQKAIAEKFNTNDTVISRIKLGKTYKHID